jgi:hypothetical protein
VSFPIKQINVANASDIVLKYPAVAKMWDEADASNIKDITFGDCTYSLITSEKFKEILKTLLGFESHFINDDAEYDALADMIEMLFVDLPEDIYINLEGTPATV